MLNRKLPKLKTSIQLVPFFGGLFSLAGSSGRLLIVVALVKRKERLALLWLYSFLVIIGVSILVHGKISTGETRVFAWFALSLCIVALFVHLRENAEDKRMRSEDE